MDTLLSTNFVLPNQVSKYVGKVREVISLENDLLVIVTTDRLSAFDVVLPRGIPHKGKILNQISLHLMIMSFLYFQLKKVKLYIL